MQMYNYVYPNKCFTYFKSINKAVYSLILDSSTYRFFSARRETDRNGNMTKKAYLKPRIAIAKTVAMITIDRFYNLCNDVTVRGNNRFWIVSFVFSAA